MYSFLFVFSGIILLAGTQTPAAHLSDSHILSVERMCFQIGSGKSIRWRVTDVSRLIYVIIYYIIYYTII